jgi:hypothetical protein
LLIGEQQRIRRVSPDGTISTIFQAQRVHANRLGDFAGRYGDTIEALCAIRDAVDGLLRIRRSGPGPTVGAWLRSALPSVS